jgi:hypothetical protein
MLKSFSLHIFLAKYIWKSSSWKIYIYSRSITLNNISKSNLVYTLEWILNIVFFELGLKARLVKVIWFFWPSLISLDKNIRGNCLLFLWTLFPLQYFNFTLESNKKKYGKRIPNFLTKGKSKYWGGGEESQRKKRIFQIFGGVCSLDFG